MCYLHDHHQELGHDVGGDDLHGEDPGDPGPLQQTLGPLRDEGLRGEGHGEEEERDADHGGCDPLSVVGLLRAQQRRLHSDH